MNEERAGPTIEKGMKLAFVAQPFDGVLPPFQTSIGLWTYHVAECLSRSCDVTVYAPRNHLQRVAPQDGRVKYRFIPRIHYRILLALSRPFSSLFNTKRPYFSSISFCLGYSLKIAQALRAQGCDIVHVLNFSQIVPVIRRLNPGIKIVLHMQCEWLTQLDRAMIEGRLRETNSVIGCSEYITGKIRTRFPGLAERCHTVYNGVDTDHFSPRLDQTPANKKDGTRLLFVGRISPEKGVHVLLDAFQNLVQRHPQTELEIVGPEWRAPLEFIVAGSDDPRVSALRPFYAGNYLSRLTTSLPPELSTRISFAGHVPHHQLPAYYRASDLLINPSLSEAFGISLVEAMATAIPVVATQVGGMQEVVEHGKTGLLVEAGDARALAEAISRLLSDGERRRSMGEAGRARAVELFSWEQVVNELGRCYNKLCAGG